jgi:hypothetical protein
MITPTCQIVIYDNASKSMDMWIYECMGALPDEDASMKLDLGPECFSVEKFLQLTD